jgi:hypothetical protein
VNFNLEFIAVVDTTKWIGVKETWSRGIAFGVHFFAGTNKINFKK